MLTRVYAWIPRSYVHAVEVYETVKNKKLNLKTNNLKLNDKTEFIINNYADYKEIKFTLDEDGLYTFTTKLPEKNIEEEIKKYNQKIKELLKEEIIKKAHAVTYDQIREGILPLNYSTITLIKKNYNLEGYEKFKVSGLTIYYKKDSYTHNTITYVAGTEREDIYKIMDYKAFTDIIGHFYYEMMNKMEEYHAGTKEVIDLLESHTKSPLIDNAYLNLDLVKKDAIESWTKIEQASNSLKKKEESFKKIIMGLRSKTITHKLK